MSFKVWQGTVEVYDHDAFDYVIYEGTGFFARRADAEAALEAIVKPTRPPEEMMCEITSVTVKGDVADLTDDPVPALAEKP